MRKADLPDGPVTIGYVGEWKEVGPNADPDKDRGGLGVVREFMWTDDGGFYARWIGLSYKSKPA